MHNLGQNTMLKSQKCHKSNDLISVASWFSGLTNHLLHKLLSRMMSAVTKVSLWKHDVPLVSSSCSSACHKSLVSTGYPL